MTTTNAVETVVYARQGTAELALDVYSPAAPSRRCAVLVFHGGAWRLGAKELMRPRAEALAAAGFTAITVQYTLVSSAPWPAPLADATAAIAWTRDNAARLGINPGRVVVQGHSAGGHIALLTGTLDAPARPDAIIAYYPQIGFYATGEEPADPPATHVDGVGLIPGWVLFPSGTPLDDEGRVPGWMLFPPEASQAELDAASPVAAADATFPPTVIFHGGTDKIMNYRSSVALHRRLTGLGVPAELHVYRGRDHEFDMAPTMTAATVAAATSFLEHAVLDKEGSDAEARGYAFPPGA
jgi:acetyl esterase/lipase